MLTLSGLGLEHEFTASTQSKFVVTSRQKLPKPYKIPFPEKGKLLVLNLMINQNAKGRLNKIINNF